MFNLIKGAKIENNDGLKEAYKVLDQSIEAVIDAQNIMKLMKLFIHKFENESFFIFIEVPSNLDDEEEYHDGELHKDVYFLDDLLAEEVNDLFDMFEEILINDGLSAFGVGCDKGEIGKYKYNMMKAFCNDIYLIKDIFNECNIVEDYEMITPWDLINESNPGLCISYEDSSNASIYDVVKCLQKFGMYKYETVKDGSI